MVGENMFIYGVLTAVAFFCVVILLLYIGYRIGKKPKQTVKPDEEELRKAAKLREDFAKLMNYDVSTALQRKKVE
ncbi:hypothetical protein [Heyndrickxia oleronia]|uniref:hypothetical protein n=2 Tax=Heyndrickxia TaxID=2837504 RepID=UPI001BB377C1|nr:hypothetical protein [Heyndrickxia oleronia]